MVWAPTSYSDALRVVLVAVVMVAPATSNADVAVIVSAKSTVSTLTVTEISQIFLGKSTVLRPIDGAPQSPARNRFYFKVTGKDEAQVTAIWSRLLFTGKAYPPKQLSSDEEIIKAVLADPRTIAYIDGSLVDARLRVVYEVK
jgi:ABC-type phosphate transport system substrate-binding protein